jgi:hypothetical protein
VAETKNVKGRKDMGGAKTEIRLLDLKWGDFAVCNHCSAIIHVHLLFGTSASGAP